MRLLNEKLAFAAAIIAAALLLAIGIQQETPIGVLRGEVTAKENGHQIPAWVYLSGKIDGEQVYYSKQTDDDGTFKFTKLPAGVYKLEINSEAHHMRPVKIKIKEGHTRKIKVALVPNSPFLELFVHQHIFTPDEKPQVTSRGFGSSKSIRLEIYKLDLNAFLIKYDGSLQRMLAVNTNYNDQGTSLSSTTNVAANPDAVKIDSIEESTTRRDAEGIFVKRIDIHKLTPGLYALLARSGNVSQIDWMQVTSLGLVTKSAGGQLLTYTVDLKSGSPIPSAQVDVYTGAEKSAFGKTGTDGLLELNLPVENSDSQRVIIAHSGESSAFVTPWFPGINTSDKIAYIYTERPVYRPGQRVYFRGIIRQLNNEKYTVPSGQPLNVEVRDGRDTLIYRTSLKTDRFGCYFGSFKLNDEAASGYYSLTTSISGENISDGTEFRVASYKKPEFNVNVKFSKKRYVRGQNAIAHINATYYFGAPVANASISYIVRRSPYWLFEGDDYEYGSEDFGGYGDVVTEGKSKTDANGSAEIEFPAIWPQPTEADAWDNDQLFSLEVTVRDSSEREVQAEGSTVATRGEFAIEVQPDRYVASPNEEVKVNIKAAYYNKRPVRNQGIEVVTGRTIWSHDYRNSHFEQISSRTVTTDSKGRASFAFHPKKPGDIQVIAKARDDRGNLITGRSDVWSYAGGVSDEGYQFKDIEIVTDKKSYNPGDTAKVMINSGKVGSTALVTVEGARVYQRLTVKLKSRFTLLRIPIKSEYKPNFYIAACCVENKDYFCDETYANVSLKAQRVSVKITPNKKKYAPGEEATFRIKTTDSQGKPLSAELSMGVVDESIYAISEDMTTNILDYFYSERSNSVSTNFSFPEIYLSDPDKAGAGFKGIVRKKFRDTAFWSPNIITDSNGNAGIKFKMPDNLTTWRVTVRAITMSTQCGQAQTSVITQKDFLVRLEMPRFLVQTDSSTISAIVHNYTGRIQHVKVDLKAPGLKLDGDFRREIDIDDKGEERVDWNVRATKPGNYPITVYAIADRASDAVEVNLPVHPHAVEQTSVQTGSMDGLNSAKINVLVDKNYMPRFTHLKIELAPSIASTLLNSLQYLAQYPYGCTEQTTSSFIPDVILWRSMRELGIQLPRTESSLPDMVSNGLFKLYRYQLNDGGWSWYEYGKSDNWMTAYVCYALIQAKNAGFTINQTVLDNAITNLLKVVKKRKLDTEVRAYVAYVLALAGKNTSTQLGEIAVTPHISSETIATVALGFAAISQDNMHAKNALNKLMARAIIDPETIHWTAKWHQFGANDIEPTALALQAIMKIDPHNPAIPKVVRWLMEQRYGDYWYSTRDTAMVLYAMSDYLMHTNELAPDYKAEVFINSKMLGSFSFNKESVFEPAVGLTIRGSELKTGSNSIEITKSGTGNLYYTTDLRQYLAKKHIPAAVSGAKISISRSYYMPSPIYYQTASDRSLGSRISSCNVGDIVMVRLLIYNKKRIDHMMLEDNIPAGFEIVDKGDVDPWEWNNWWCGQDIRDNGISFYLDSISPGKHVVDYQIRASVRGEYHTLPARLWAMYRPEVHASTAESRFSVR